MLAALSGFLIPWMIITTIQNIIYARNARKYLAFIEIGYRRILMDTWKPV